jgi:predicted RNA-binding protein associated with RNAse of E/G family
MTRTITVEYIRPGKETSYYEEDVLIENDEYLKSFKQVPEEIAERLTRSLRENHFIAPDQYCACMTKIYFFHEYFNLLIFQDEHEGLLGYYSDIGTPLIKTPDGYQMTDWFLDIWLSPDGTLFELDEDEFEDALARNLLSTAEAEIARATFTRLIREVKTGIYPGAYLK